MSRQLAGFIARSNVFDRRLKDIERLARRRALTANIARTAKRQKNQKHYGKGGPMHGNYLQS
jgi:hypothetical protein